jgi:hypothetical protein
MKEDFDRDKEEMLQVIDLRDKDLVTLNAEYEEVRIKVEAFQREVDELRGLCYSLKDMIDD